MIVVNELLQSEERVSQYGSCLTETCERDRELTREASLICPSSITASFLNVKHGSRHFPSVVHDHGNTKFSRDIVQPLSPDKSMKFPLRSPTCCTM